MDSQRGFTLVEAVVAVAVMALAMGVVVAGVTAGGFGELRGKTAMLSGLMRSTFNQAALDGQTFRLVFDLQNRVIKRESTEQTFNLDPESNLFHAQFDEKTAFKEEESQLDWPEGEGLEELEAFVPPSALQALVKMGQPPDHSTDSQFSENGEGLLLGEDVRLVDVWTEGMDQPAKEGLVYLYFFPHGYTQEAVINLENEDGHVLALTVQALTGNVKVHHEYQEPPK